ncbi:MAG: nucleotidyl transferase AbiEii/AbiGii toxin family protein [Enhygromyxa sp.]
MELYQELRALVRALDDAEVDYALCGGLALAVHGLPRATRDIDLLALPADLDRIREIARRRGFTIEALPMTFSSSGLSVQRFSKLGGSEPLMLDILLVNESLEPVWNARTRVAYEDGSVSVVSRRGLITLKLSAGRPQDLVDIQQLEELGED